LVFKKAENKQTIKAAHRNKKHNIKNKESQKTSNACVAEWLRTTRESHQALKPIPGAYYYFYLFCSTRLVFKEGQQHKREAFSFRRSFTS
jgi:hypothetical protein